MTEERAVTVLTCRGDVSDPSFPRKLQKLVSKLHRLVNRGKRKDEFQVTKVEPWNSVRVTFNIPREAAERLQRLAESGDRSLREMGILSVQVGGDQTITLTLANSGSSVDLNLNQAIELGVTTSTSAPPLRCNTDPSPSSSSSPCQHRISDSSPPASLRDVFKNIHNPATVIAAPSRSVSSSVSSVSPSRGLSTPPTPPDSVSLESRPESASLEESVNDPLKSQLLNSSSSSTTCSVNLNNIKQPTNSSVNVQKILDSSRMIRDPKHHDLSSQVTIDISEPPSFSHNSEPFRSPNVLVTDPLHIVPHVGGVSSSSISPSVSSAMVMSAIIPTGKRRSSSQSSPGNMVPAPFPFASMQHAMHTKQGNSNHARPLHVMSPGKSHEVDPKSRSVDTNVPLSRVTLSGPSNAVMSNLRTGSMEVSAAKSASSNVALTSPLLVNLLQTESSQIESKLTSLKSTKMTNSRTKTISSNPEPSFPSPPSSTIVPKPDLKPINDLRLLMSTTVNPRTTSSSDTSPSLSPPPPNVTRLEPHSVSCNPPFNNNPVSNSRHPVLEPPNHLGRSNDLLVVAKEHDDRNGCIDLNEKMDRDLKNHDCSSKHQHVVNDNDGRRRDKTVEPTNDTLNDTSRQTNRHRNDVTSLEQQSNHTGSMEVMQVTSNQHHINNKKNSSNNSFSLQVSVNGNHEEEDEDDEEMPDDDEEDEEEEEVLDDEDLDELSDLPPLEPPDMAMDMDDCSSGEACNTSTTPTFNSVFADQEAVSLGSLDGRQVYSVASGDHNYISVKTETNQLDTNCRSNSAHDHFIVGEDPTQSDLESRPNFKCSGDLSSRDQMLNDSQDQVSMHVVSGPPHRKVTLSSSTSASSNRKESAFVNNCHPKKDQDLVIDQGLINNKHSISINCDNVSTGCKKLDSKLDQSCISGSGGQERRVNSSKMKITSESLSADLFLVNSVPIQGEPQTSTMEESSFFKPEPDHHATTAVSILKKKKSKGSGGSQPGSGQGDPGAGMKRRRVVKEGGGGGTNNRL